MNRPHRLGMRTFAAAVIVAAWAPAIASILLSWVFRLPDLPLPGTFLSPAPQALRSRFDDIGVTIALVYAPLAALFLLRRPGPLAALLATHAVGSGLAAFGVQYGRLAATHDGLPGAGFFAHLGGWAFVPGTFLTAIVPLMLLAGTRRLRRPLVWATTAAAAVATVASATHQSPEAPTNPLAVHDPRYQAALPAVFEAAAAVALIVSLASVCAVAIRAIRSPRRSRYQLVWLLIGQVFLTSSYLVTVLPDGRGIPDAIWTFGAIAPIVGQIFYPSGVLVVGLQDSLRGIDLAVGRVLSATIVAAISVSGYLIATSLLSTQPLGGLGAPAPGMDRQPATVGFIAAALLVVAVYPLQLLVQRQVHRLVYAGSPPEHFVASLGSQVGDFATGEGGVRALLAAIREALQLGSVRLDGVPELQIGLRGANPSSRELRVPLPDAAGTGAALVVAADAPGISVGARTRRLLEDLAPVLGTVVLLALASVSLDRTRAEVLTSRHAERRTLRRELHDGLGPALSGARFAMSAAANLLEHGEREEATEMVSRADEMLSECIDELAMFDRSRTMSADELPVGGLALALERLIASFGEAGPELRLTVRDSGELAPGAAGSLFRIASEALLNAIRHARAERIEIVLDPAAGETLVVMDDGRGLSGPATSGVGLASMREWAQRAGAELTVSSPAGGGTRIAVSCRRAGVE